MKTYYTNLSPAGAYQGYGAPKGSFALQTALAELAAELGMDQLDLIEKNRVRSGSRIEILRSLGEGRPGAAGHPGRMRPGRDDRRAAARPSPGTSPKPAAADPDWKIGRGAVIIQQGSGLPGLDAANAEIRLLADGTVLMLSGGADLGTGLDTVTAKARRRDPGAGHGGRDRHLRRHRHHPLRQGRLRLQRHLLLRQRRCARPPRTCATSASRWPPAVLGEPVVGPDDSPTAASCAARRAR